MSLQRWNYTQNRQCKKDSGGTSRKYITYYFDKFIWLHHLQTLWILKKLTNNQ